MAQQGLTSRKAAALVAVGLSLTLLVVAACGDFGGGNSDRPEPKANRKEPEANKVPISQNVFLEVQGKRRRVLISAKVCLRDGALEGLLTRTGRKTHEYILSADVDARQVHGALELAKAEAGSPVRFQPEFSPPRGTAIRVSLTYELDGRRHTVPAGSWIRNEKTQRPLESDWVFGGSMLIDNPLNPGQKTYLANDGDLICVVNMESAMLDLPIRSLKALELRSYRAYTERIPPDNTPVVVILEPVLTAGK